jgi:ATP-binding cassette subfamily B (MDR/TAP) protein 1
MVPTSRVWKLSKPEFVNIFFGSIGAILNGATFPVWGVLLTKCTVLFFELQLGSDEIRSQALQWAIGFVALGAVFFMAITLQSHQFAISCERLTSRIRNMCFDAMMRQEIAWFDNDENSAGALTTRLATDSAAIRTMTAETLNVVFVNVSTLGIAFGIAFSQSWQMSLAFLGVFPFIGFATFIQMQSMSGTTGKNSNDGDIRAGALLSEAINSIRTVSSFCLETSTNAAYYRFLQDSSKTDTKVGFSSGLGFGISQSSMFFALAFLFWFGGWLIVRGDIDFEAMFLVLNPILFSSFGVGIAAQGLGDIGKAKVAVNRIFAIIDRKPSIDCSSESGMKLTHVKGDI